MEEEASVVLAKASTQAFPTMLNLISIGYCVRNLGAHDMRGAGRSHLPV